MLSFIKKPTTANEVATPPQPRIWELDFIRGLCVAMMVIDHTLFDMGFLFLQEWFPQGEGGVIFYICSFAKNIYWEHPLRLILHTLALVGFIGACGISCSLSRSNLKRGLKLLVVALLLTAVTALLDHFIGYNQFLISFGILHLLAIAILIYAALRPLGHIPALALGVAIIVVGFIIDPAANQSDNFILLALGLTHKGFSADYFPLIPYLGWFLVGASLGAVIYKKKTSLFPNSGKAKFFRPFYWLGRHALIVYILHQPLIFGLLWLLGAIFA